MLEIITKISTDATRVALSHLESLFAFPTDIYLPLSGDYDRVTKEGSMYNYHDNEYRFGETPSFEAVNLLYANVMDLTRVRSTYLMDDYDIEEPVVYTIRKDITENSRLITKYAGKELRFFVKKITVLESIHEDDDEAVRRLELEPIT